MVCSASIYLYLGFAVVVLDPYVFCWVSILLSSISGPHFVLGHSSALELCNSLTGYSAFSVYTVPSRCHPTAWLSTGPSSPDVGRIVELLDS